jgi:trans-AT polyketide synthase/acyltransferase/oxidoreductase domain-containing protein
VGALTAWVFAGQGSQRKGMGAQEFDRFPERCAAADAILGYSIRDLCLNDEPLSDNGRHLLQTQYAQPAIYVVGALHVFAMQDEAPDFLAGHSVGEYIALLAAGCFDFETGLRLVQKRGELMARASGGGMLAVVGVEVDRIRQLLPADVDVANYNSRQQVVLSGPQDSLSQANKVLARAGARCVPLAVSAAFHSRSMADAAREFTDFVRSFTFEEPRVPVISNVTAEPYAKGTIVELLAKQITSPVRWRDSMLYLRRQGVGELREIGSTRILVDFWKSACEEPAPAPIAVAAKKNHGAENLGSAAFRRDYGLRYAYLAGSMFRGVASVALILRMARAGLMGFLGTGGLTIEEIDAALREIKTTLGRDGRYGANLLHQLDDPDAERAVVALYLRHDVRCVEAAAYMQITPALVHYRFSGAYRDAGGRPCALRRVVAKVSRPEVASAFMQPAPEAIVRRLVEEGALTAEEGEIARLLPISHDVCVESDSAGHTDGGVALALLPMMTRLRDEMMERHRYHDRIRIGASGGLGAPEAVAAAFVLGAEFIVTGSINQCSPEAGTSGAVKDLLATLDVQDTGYAPAGDMFEIGAKVQVVRKGTLFTPRANKLYQLYRQHESLDAIERETRNTIETTYFRRSFDEVWRDTRDYLSRSGQTGEIEKAERNARHRMARVFRWYFAHSIQVALEGNLAEKVNFQVHCGPAMGAFNRFVKGTDLESWQERHVDTIAERLMTGAAEVLRRSAASM